MSRVYVKFSSKGDRIKGLYTLVRQTRVEGLSGNVFGISEEDLPILKNSQVEFDIASPEEVKQAYREFHEVWNLKRRKRGLRKKTFHETVSTYSGLRAILKVTSIS